MATSERERLLDLYASAAAALSERVAELASAGVSPESDRFERAWRSCQEAHQRYAEIQHRMHEFLRDQCALQCALKDASKESRSSEPIEARISRPAPRLHEGPATDA